MIMLTVAVRIFRRLLIDIYDQNSTQNYLTGATIKNRMSASHPVTSHSPRWDTVDLVEGGFDKETFDGSMYITERM